MSSLASGAGQRFACRMGATNLPTNSKTTERKNMPNQVRTLRRRSPQQPCITEDGKCDLCGRQVILADKLALAPKLEPK